MELVERVKKFLVSRNLPADGVKFDGERVRWGRMSLVDYGDFVSVEDPMSDHDFVGATVEEALTEYYG